MLTCVQVLAISIHGIHDGALGFKKATTRCCSTDAAALASLPYLRPVCLGNLYIVFPIEVALDSRMTCIVAPG